MPPVFRYLQEAGQVSDFDMLRTFNCGVGLVMAVPAEQVEELLGHFDKEDIDAFEMGDIIEAQEGQELVLFR